MEGKYTQEFGDELTGRAEDTIYCSYLSAAPFFPLNTKDEIRRSPDLLLPWLGTYKAQNNIVITGSKGKGSLARMISVLFSQNERTGLLISPHIRRFEDRISIDGNPISPRDMLQYAKDVWKDISYLEDHLKKGEYISPAGIIGLIAMRYFTEHKTVWNVLECGRGALYDDINRIPHNTAVIGRIFKEHTKELGDSLEQIAVNKAAVITEKTGIVFSVRQKQEVLEIIEDRAKKTGARLFLSGRDFFERNLELSMAGSYQQEHAALAICLYSFLKNKPKPTKSDEMLLCRVNIPGRMEILSEKPFCLLDSSIHKESACEVVGFLKSRGTENVALVLCLPDNKDISGIGEIMKPLSEKIYLTKSEHPHYLTECDQSKLLKNIGINCKYIPDLKNAIKTAFNTGLPAVILCANVYVERIRNIAKELLQKK